MQRTLTFAITWGFVLLSLQSVAPLWGQAVNSAELSGVVTDSSKLLWLNPAAFTPNPPGAFGNAGVFSLVGPRCVSARLSAPASRGFCR